ncbi:MAG: ATP-binding cassette domain-containing protein, partial [Bacilli bacterium]|nr:ATP-binding cassette domain-containing protein [Bacilli bacterium]
MIVLKKLNKVYGEDESATVALKDVDLVIEKGKFTAIVGKSGSGKTTLMNMVGALDKPTSGSLTIDEVEITNLTEDLLASYRNKTIGFVFQSFYLEPTFTVLENVAMPLTIAGVDRIERETKAKEILIKLGLEDKIYKKASDLSS